MGIAEATFYIWKKKYGQLGVTELRMMHMLEDENARLKHLVPELTLDQYILQEVLRKQFEADPPLRARPLDSGALRGECAADVSTCHVTVLDVVSAQLGAGSDTVADVHPEMGDEVPAVRLSAHSRHAAARTLGS